MTNHQARLDETFHALADPTRRAVIRSLGRGPASVSELARPFEMALPTFLQHLKVLEHCGLIRSRKVGRVRTCELKPQRLADAENWLNAQRAFWAKRLDQLDDPGFQPAHAVAGELAGRARHMSHRPANSISHSTAASTSVAVSTGHQRSRPMLRKSTIGR